MMSCAHDFWNDDTIHAMSLREHCDMLLPGEIAITWYRGPDSCEMVLSGNQADEFLERYRAAPDPETKELVMLHAIEGMG